MVLQLIQEVIATDLQRSEVDGRLRLLENTNMFEVRKEGFLYQGDMMFTREQVMQILQRKMMANLSDKWPRDVLNSLNINYVMDGKYKTF